MPTGTEQGRLSRGGGKEDQETMRRRWAAARRAMLVGAVAGLSLLALGGTAWAQAHAQAEQLFVERINADRATHGLPALTPDGLLTDIARDWTPRMIAGGELEHRPMSQLADLVHDDWQRLAENVGFTLKSGASERELVDRLHGAFMDSPGHRANVLGDHDFVGVGVRLGDDGGMWVTVNFMKAPAAAHTPMAPSGEPQIAEAVRVSRGVFASAGAGGRAAAFAVVGRADVFADVLGGASLAGDRAPILFTPGPALVGSGPGLHPATRAEIDRVLGGSGTVYLLGGSSAVPEAVARELSSAGYDVRRLAGPSRVETSVAVAEETVRVHGGRDEVLLARADQWPDAVTGGAYAAGTSTPLLLTNQASLHPAVASFLERRRPARRWALGGTVALADQVVRSAKATRVSGPERTATSVAIAQRLWGRARAEAGDRYTATPSHGEDAWAYALAQAPWAAAHGAPQLLVGTSVPPSVATYLADLGYGGAVTGDLFAASAVPDGVVGDVQRLLGR